ncbi:MAG: hypothetical protein ABJX32_16625 [Tateyamaria sp.]|uniref:hypothetical protein n=1 Tax=Tateyamaria sp. TaxID=1929288 RepID=UPI00329B259C
MKVGGLDIGQMADHTALTTMQAADGVDATCWMVREVHRLPLGIPLMDQVPMLQDRLDQLDVLGFDSGGVGQG